MKRCRLCQAVPNVAELKGGWTISCGKRQNLRCTAETFSVIEETKERAIKKWDKVNA